MPRSGVNGTYNLPPNTNNQAPNTPISSSMFNAFASDVQQTFNDPTPVAYGGTGQAELVLPSDEFGIKDGSNGTKRVDFDLSGISASTTRTLTIQDSDGTIALLSDIGSLQQDVSDLLNGAVRGDIDQTSKDEIWKQQAKVNLGVPLSRYYESTPQAITLGGLLTFTHGLGSSPKLVKIQIVCVTADEGYSVGDKLWISELGSGDGGTSAGAFSFSIYEDAADSATIKVRNPAGSGALFLVYSVKSSGARAVLTASRWNLIVRAWA